MVIYKINPSKFKAMKKIEDVTCIKFEDRSQTGHTEPVAYLHNIDKFYNKPLLKIRFRYTW